MELPFTIEDFYGVFRDYNMAVWPLQWLLVAQAAFLLGVLPDLGLIAAGVVSVALLATAGQQPEVLKS